MNLHELARELKIDVKVIGYICAHSPGKILFYSWYAKLSDMAYDKRGLEPVQGQGNSMEEALVDLVQNVKGRQVIYKVKPSEEALVNSTVLKEFTVPSDLTAR